MSRLPSVHRRSPHTTHGLWGGVTACLFVCLLLQHVHLWSPSGAIARQRSYHNNIAALETSLHHVQASNQRLTQQLGHLSVDPRWVEAQARYHLNYVKPHETLFVYSSGALSKEPARVR